ncbi:MAG: adenylosuccinate lyase [Clostridia bacterium]|nr:adenylosuccinate lyase [Clostridia bacterium]
MSEHNSYVSPFSTRYASPEMQYLFSDNMKFTTWRKLWLSLAKAEKALGLDITDEQIEELASHVNTVDYEVAKAREKEVRHDVMAHIYAYGVDCPKAAPIIHLGATSCYVGDNTDVIVLKEAMKIVEAKLCSVISNLSDFALKYKDMPCLGYTHLQPAQCTTVGKRAALWINELLYDLDELRYRIKNLKMLGSKGTTGTQASFMELFGGDSDKIKKMEQMIAEDFGFDGVVPVSGQTYSRKVDAAIISTLSGIAQSAYKFANDMRILQAFKEIEEPFETNQVGSSAMPYKRNPMRCERICALSRYVICDSLNPAITASTQWFERTLDDSANRRISVSEAFLAIDAVLGIYINVTSGLVVYPEMIKSRLMAELPFMASENIMMDAVKKGGNRQKLHEKIRVYSIEAGKTVKEQGKENDLLKRIASDSEFGLSYEELKNIVSPEKYTGRASEQTVEFIENCVKPALEKFKGPLQKSSELNV